MAARKWAGEEISNGAISSKVTGRSVRLCAIPTETVSHEKGHSTGFSSGRPTQERLENRMEMAMTLCGTEQVKQGKDGLNVLKKSSPQGQEL